MLQIHLVMEGNLEMEGNFPYVRDVASALIQRFVHFNVINV